MTVVTATKTRAASRWPLRPCNTTQRAAETQVSGGADPACPVPRSSVHSPTRGTVALSPSALACQRRVEGKACPSAGRTVRPQACDCRPACRKPDPTKVARPGPGARAGAEGGGRVGLPRHLVGHPTGPRHPAGPRARGPGHVTPQGRVPGRPEWERSWRMTQETLRSGLWWQQLEQGEVRAGWVSKGRGQ